MAVHRERSGAKASIISEKYITVRTLQKNSNSTVILARHKGLGVLRVLKSIRKEQASDERAYLEAHILKNLNHPGIPIIYDVEEDLEHIHIIEEFVEGESLQSYVRNQTYLSKSEALEIIEYVCGVVQYLHNQQPRSILHLDITPQNIIVAKGSIKVIDFGNSSYEGNIVAGNIGTKGYAPMEQFCGNKLTKASDIYSIGGVLKYMLTGDLRDRDQYMEAGVKDIINRCQREYPEERYSSIEELLKDVKNIKSKINTQQLSLKIGVVGLRPGIGTTHIALLLTKAIRHCGYEAYYREANQSQDAARIIEFYKAQVDSKGIAIVKGCPMLMEFNQAVNVSNGNIGIEVVDIGNCQISQCQFDKLVLVGSFGAQNYSRTLDLYDELRKRQDTICIINLCRSSDLVMSKVTGRPGVFAVPFFEEFYSKEAVERMSKIVKRLMPRKHKLSGIGFRSRIHDMGKMAKKILVKKA